MITILNSDMFLFNHSVFISNKLLPFVGNTFILTHIEMIKKNGFFSRQQLLGCVILFGKLHFHQFMELFSQRTKKQHFQTEIFGGVWALL